MKAAGVIGLIYGALVLVGGLIGYLMAGSLASALAGGGFGVATLVSSWAMFREKPAGWYAAVAIAASLAVFFGARFWQGGQFMPTGLMAVVSVLAAALLVGLHLREAKQPPTQPATGYAPASPPPPERGPARMELR